MGLVLAGSVLTATPALAQMSNHRRPSANGHTATRSEQSRSRDHVATESRSSRSSQSMNNNRQRPTTATTPNRHEATRGNDNRKDRNNGNGGNHNYGNNSNGNRGNSGNSGNYRNRGNDNHNDRNYNNRGNDNRNHNHNRRNRGHDAYRDYYSWNYHHNNWSRPLPPPARVHRPAPYYYHRPHIPSSWRPYHGAPIIDRILGLTFGTIFDASLNYLYTNGYNIDGYEDRVVYLRNVNMLNLLWADVMLCYDDYGRLYNAQFIHSSYYNDRSRYNRIYHDLCAVYGTPVDFDSRGVTWFGGNRTGYVTLTMTCTGSRYYTNLYIGN